MRGREIDSPAAAVPKAGGVFVYLRETFGPGVAFLFGWTIMLAEPAASAGMKWLPWARTASGLLGSLVPPRLSAGGSACGLRK